MADQQLLKKMKIYLIWLTAKMCRFYLENWGKFGKVRLGIDLGSIGQTGLYIYAADIFPIRPNENNKDHNQIIDFMLTLTYVLIKN